MVKNECRSVAFLRLHSCDDGSVKWLLATRRRRAKLPNLPTQKKKIKWKNHTPSNHPLFLGVLFVNVASVHRKCRYCCQLSTCSMLPCTSHHFASHRIPGSPHFFFLYHHAAPPKPFHKCLLRVPKLHSRSLSHPLSPSRSPLTSVVEWANFLAYECVCFVFHHYIFFLTFFPIFAIFFVCTLLHFSMPFI